MLLVLFSFAGKWQCLSYGKNPTVRRDKRKFPVAVPGDFGHKVSKDYSSSLRPGFEGCSENMNDLLYLRFDCLELNRMKFS